MKNKVKKLRLNIDNEGYYSEAFIKGWKTGVEAQFKADVREQPPKGEWQITVNEDYRCTNCKKITSSYTANFCPNCGADMRGKKHDV